MPPFQPALPPSLLFNLQSWEEMHPGPAFSLVLRSEAEAAAEILAAKEGGREGGREGGHLPWLPRMQAAVKR